jgi:hypothetical protein
MCHAASDMVDRWTIVVAFSFLAYLTVYCAVRTNRQPACIMTAIHESITSLSGGTLAQHKEKFNLKVCYLMSVFGHLSDVQLFLVVVAPAAVVIRVPRKDGR